MRTRVLWPTPRQSSPPRRKVIWGARAVAAVWLLCAGVSPSAAASASKAGPNGLTAAQSVGNQKLDGEVTRRAQFGLPWATTSVIVTLAPGATLPPEFKHFATSGRLDIINGVVLELPNWIIRKLEASPTIFRIHYNREVQTHNYRTAVTVGARLVQQALGYTGAGVGVAVIDSGITTWHDDLTNRTATRFPYGNQRVTKFVDFVHGQALPYDDNGHGTHVAGTIVGNGADSHGEKSGIAPDASLIALKVLDGNGGGRIGDLIAALNWVAQNARTYNIRVVNMSIGAPIHESYKTDPLTLAAKAVTDRGITIVAAAGNLGKNAAGQLQYGGITAPGNAPWVLTVGASSTMGTMTRRDDTMASYSSAGPTYKDYLAKPDLVAPGTGTVSLAVPGSTFYATKSAFLLDGAAPLGSKPYLALSGTSMAAPVVTGTVALMLQANPNLTPNLIKAILQYTAEEYPGYNPLRQGAGFLNTLGAVSLAKYYATPHAANRPPVQRSWSRHLIWGNHLLRRGVLVPSANAWATNVVWGTAKTLGTDGDNIVWGTAADGDNIVWGTAVDGDNIVWGTAADGDNIVWGTSCGTKDCDNVVWGTVNPLTNIIWGTAADGDNIVWGTAALDNIVWGTAADADVTWGSSGPETVVFSDSAAGPVPDLASELGDPTITSVTTDPVTGATTTTVTDSVTGVVLSVTKSPAPILPGGGY